MIRDILHQEVEVGDVIVYPHSSSGVKKCLILANVLEVHSHFLKVRPFQRGRDLINAQGHPFPKTNLDQILIVSKWHTVAVKEKDQGQALEQEVVVDVGLQ